MKKNDIDALYMQGYLSISLIGCLTAMVFIMAFWLAMQSKERFGLPESLSEQTSLVIAGIVIMPIWLPFVWKRLTRLKLGPIEFDLSEFGVKGKLALVEELSDINALQMGPSYIPNLIDKIAEAIVEAETKHVAEIQFGVGKTPWWSTRLYLLAALAKDYTGIRQLIFLESYQGKDRIYAGSATPAMIFQSLGQDNPRLEEVYQEAKKIAGKHDEGPKKQIAWIAEHFVDQLQKETGGEEKAKEIVSRQFLERLMPMTGGIERPLGSTPAWLIYEIVNRSESYVPLIKTDGQLDLIVDRIKLTQQAAKIALRQQLDSC